MASGTRARCRRAAAALLACTATALALGVASPAVASGGTPPSGAATLVRLVHQTPVVSAPGHALLLALSRTGPGAASDTTVTLTLYQRLTTRSGLLAAIGTAGPSGAVSATPPIAGSCVATGGQLRLVVRVAPLETPLAPRTLCGHRAPVLRLGCSSGCDGVYPMRITVAGAGMRTSIVTLVTYASRSQSPLRVAWVVRVAGRTRGLAQSAGVLHAVAAHPLVPVTLDVQGDAVASGLSRPGASTAISLLAATSAARAHELMAEPYVAADLGALRASDLPTEVLRQFALTKVVLHDAGVLDAPVGTVSYGTGPQTPTMAAAVASVGVRHLLVEGTALAVDPATTLSWGGAFTIAGVPGGPTALAADTALGALSEDTASDPGLVAAQFLGQLAFLHFEQPYLADPRVAVVVTTATRAVTAAFGNDVLEGLQANPVLSPVTASEAFAAVPVGANGFPAVRALALGPSRAWPPATVSEILHLRITTDALRSAIVSGDSPVPSIEGQLLTSERVLAPSMREAVFGHVQHRLAFQLGYFRFDTGSITLTESSGSLPITVVSDAPYTIRATLRLRSAHLVFPGAPLPVLLPPSVRSWRMSAQALTSGDLPLTAMLISPDGRLLIAHAAIVVRVTPTSIVGIALTVGAVLVLILWWVRTSRRRRPAR